MPLDEDEYSQNPTACVDGHRAAVQEKDTVHVKPREKKKQLSATVKHEVVCETTAGAAELWR